MTENNGKTQLNKEIIMEQLTSKQWWEAAAIRALKTTCQTTVAMIGTSTMIQQVDWKVVLSSAVLAGILSILTSLGGLPEVDNQKDKICKVLSLYLTYNR